MSPFHHSYKILLSMAVLALGSLACNLDFIREIAERIDTTPTDCNAEAFVVTAPSDTYDGMCNTHCTLRDAVIAANTCPGDDAIQIGAGTFSLRQRGSGNERGDLDITESVRISGISPDETIITANESWKERIFEIAAGATVRMSGLTISGGNIQTESGGGILNFGDLTLERVRLRANIAFSGAGLHNDGRAVLLDVEALDNISTLTFDALRGSNILPYPDAATPEGCGGGISNAAQMQVSGGTFSGNFSPIGAGLCNLPAGVMNVSGAQISANGTRLRPAILGGGVANFGALTMQSSQVSGNAARFGGGVYALMSRDTAGALLSLNEVSIAENQAISYLGERYGGDGGGLYIRSGSFTIERSLISGNHAQSQGGGLYFEPGSGCVWSGGACTGSELGDSYGSAIGIIRHTSIVRNRAEQGDYIGKGGGIASSGFYGQGQYRFENVTISSNQAYERGGAINARGNAEFTFVNVTIAQNWGKTTSGINVESFAVFNFKNTLIAGNSPWNCYFEGRPNINSQGYNIETGNLCQLRQATDLQLNPDTILFANILTEDNGQLVHILYPGSAVDRIPLAECLAEDQRGAARPQGERCDVGAYELLISPSSLQGFSTPVLPEASPTPTALPTPTVAPQLPTITFTKNAFCRKGPGTTYFDLTAFEAGKTADVVGRNEQGSWWLVQVPGSEQRCWVADSVGDKTGDLGLVPFEPTPVLPDEPGGFNDSSACSPNLKTRDVKLAWVDSPNESGYRLYRNGVLLTTLGANVTVYVDTVAADKSFSYEIEAINTFGASARQTTEVSACN